MLTEDSAGALIDELIKRDPAARDIVAVMRSQRRTNVKIALCFRRTMLELGMQDQMADLGMR